MSSPLDQRDATMSTLLTWKTLQTTLVQNTSLQPLEISLDAPLSCLMDSTTNPKVKTTEGEGVEHAPWLIALQE